MKGAVLAADFGFFSTLISSGSLAAAAREMGVTTPAVSKRLAQMEARLGLLLVKRNARRMALTPEGEVYLEHARRILGEVDELEGLLRGVAQAPRGLLRVNATLGFGRAYIAPLVAGFVERYPEVDVQLQLTVAPPAVSEDSWDVCVRFGPPPDARVIARKLAANRRILCASPAYLKRHGEPRSPQDLARHNCIGIRQGDEYGVWRFARNRGRASEEEQVKVRGNLTTNDGSVATQWALQGRGILLRAQWDVAGYIEKGRLRQLLPSWHTPDADIHAVWPQALRASTRLQVFVDYLSASFASESGVAGHGARAGGQVGAE
jgi:DNA-binding transcriptional LysR family regulator